MQNVMYGNDNQNTDVYIAVKTIKKTNTVGLRSAYCETE